MTLYRETFVDFEDQDGETHRFSAYQVKTVRGTKAQTTITYRDEDQVVRFTTKVPEREVWNRIYAGMVEFAA